MLGYGDGLFVMPSPIAHSLAALAVAHLALRPGAAPPSTFSATSTSARERIFWTGALIFAANAADLDFLPGLFVGDVNAFHHKATHTLIAAVVFGLLAAGVAALSGVKSAYRIGWIMGAAYATHLLLDVVTRGTREPYGMRLLWPFMQTRFVTSFHLFLDIRRESGALAFLPSLLQVHNARAVFFELVVIAGAWGAYRMVSRLREGFNGRRSAAENATLE
jgi:membrane-bound metal-dependent hydrolase YbcI (DUF457 family)